MKEIALFEFEGTACRSVNIDNQLWWVGKDVCNVLGYKNPSKALNDHCRGVTKCYPIVDSLGRTQEVRIINEPDLYRLIGGSKLPSARRFEAWIYEEVLPQIRKTGSYIPQDKQGQTDKQLSILLDRCEKSISFLLEKNSRLVRENHLYRENESLRKKLAKKNTPLSEDEKKIIRDMGTTVPVSVIAKAIDRSPSSVKRVLQKENIV